MADPKGAAVVIIGGGVTGLSAGWWLARSGVDVLVLERGIVGWEASGRNGGGATHVYSPFGLEEQRLWPQMDELLGYPGSGSVTGQARTTKSATSTRSRASTTPARWNVSAYAK